MKEGIFAMDSEAEHHKSATVEILNDLAELHGNMLTTVQKVTLLRISSCPCVFLAQQSATF